jgi:PKD repeat protein
LRSRLTRRPAQRSRTPQPCHLALETLEDRLTPSIDLLVTTANASGQQLFKQYSATGGLLNSVNIPQPPGGPATARDLVADANGKVYVYNGTFSPSLATYGGAGWTQQTYPGWDTVNNISYGGIGQFQNYVFATDMMVNGDPRGIVRFNTTDGSVTRFATNLDFIDLNVGLDGKVYGLLSGGAVFVYDPVSMAAIRNFPLQASNDYRGLAVNAAGDIFTANWNNSVSHFNGSGVFLGTLNLTGPGDGTAFGNPMDIDVAPDGSTLAVGTRTGQVVQMTSAFANVRYFRTWSGTGPQNPCFVSFATWEVPPPPPPPPTISVSDVSVVEGNNGMGGPFAQFVLTLSAPSNQQVLVNFATADGTAHGGSLYPNCPFDYNSFSGTIGFYPGSTTQVVALPIYGDTLYEGNETFTLNLSQPVNATLARPQATCTIVDDDPQPSIYLGDVTVTSSTLGPNGTSAGGGGTTWANFPVLLSNGAGMPITVSYHTTDGTAAAGIDYQGVTSGTLTIPPGVTQTVVSVPVYGDPYWDPDETFTLTLSNPSVGSLYRAQGTATIHSSLPMPTIAVSNVTVQNATSGPTPAVFAVTLSGPVSDTVQVYYTTADGTAVANTDYIGTSYFLTFAPGQTTQYATAYAIGKPLYDVDKTFNLNLMPIAGGSPYASGTATIHSAVAPPVVSIGDATVLDLNAQTTTAGFHVSLSAASNAPVTVAFTTVDDTAVAGTDYTAASGTLTFAPGQTDQDVSVTVLGVPGYEASRTFHVVLSNPQNATLGAQSGTGTIYDAPPVANAGPDQTVNEADTVQFDGSGTSNFVGDPLTYSWDFGDGGTGDGVQPTHAYADNGVYTATLTVTDGPVVSTATMTVTVLNVAPTAQVIGPGGAVPYEDLPFLVVATDPSPVDQAASFTYTVDWGDGSPPTTVQWNYSAVGVSHAYPAAGTYTVSATATDKDGATGPVGRLTITVVTAQLQNGSLFVGGTPGDDNIWVRTGDAAGDVEVVVNGQSLGLFAVTGQVVVYGGAGNDTIDVLPPGLSGLPELTLPVVLSGGDGNDTLFGDSAMGPAVLLGGAGNDTLYGGMGRNIDIGGTGWDVVYGHWNDDILIGGTTAFDNNLVALAALRAQWARTDVDFATRIGQLNGSLPGGSNGGYLLNSQTVFGDDAGNFLFGSDGSDWFIAEGGTNPDHIFDQNPEDFVTYL